MRLTERTLGAGVLSDEAAARAVELIDGELDRAFEQVPEFESLVGAVRIVGLAGTVSTLAQLDVGLAKYDRDAVHHRRLTDRDVHRWRTLLGGEPPEQRLRRPGMEAGREDVIVGGLIVLEEVLARFRASELIASESDILDGIVATMLMDGL